MICCFSMIALSWWADRGLYSCGDNTIIKYLKPRPESWIYVVFGHEKCRADPRVGHEAGASYTNRNPFSTWHQGTRSPRKSGTNSQNTTVFFRTEATDLLKIKGWRLDRTQTRTHSGNRENGIQKHVSSGVSPKGYTGFLDRDETSHHGV